MAKLFKKDTEVKENELKDFFIREFNLGNKATAHDANEFLFTKFGQRMRPQRVYAIRNAIEKSFLFDITVPIEDIK